MKSVCPINTLAPIPILMSILHKPCLRIKLGVGDDWYRPFFPWESGSNSRPERNKHIRSKSRVIGTVNSTRCRSTSTRQTVRWRIECIWHRHRSVSARFGYAKTPRAAVTYRPESCIIPARSPTKIVQSWQLYCVWKHCRSRAVHIPQNVPSAIYSCNASSGSRALDATLN